MKKISLFTILITSIFFLTGCQNQNVAGTLEEIMTKVYQDVPEDQRPMALTNIEVTDETIEMYLGTKDIEYKEIIASESMTGSIAHSVVLIRTKENANIEQIKTTIKENVDPRKWICVGVEEEDVIIKNKGDLIIVIIVEDETTREKIDEAFDNL